MDGTNLETLREEFPTPLGNCGAVTLRKDEETWDGPKAKADDRPRKGNCREATAQDGAQKGSWLL